MNKYKVTYGVFHGENIIEEIEAEDQEDAYKAAYDLALENLESYGGLHGLPYAGSCEECQGEGKLDCGDEPSETCTECSGTGNTSYEDFIEMAQSWISYTAKLVE